MRFSNIVKQLFKVVYPKYSLQRIRVLPGRLLQGCLLQRIVLFGIVVMLLVVGGCSKQQVYHEQLMTFGTLVEVELWGVKPEQGRKAVAALQDDFNYMNTTWHAWHPGGLARVNQLLPTKEKFTISPSLIPLIKESTRLSALSGGRFNPAIGNLLKLWGFESDDPPHGPPPSEQDIDALLQKKPSMEDLTLNGVELQSRNSAVRLDFGGYAKGVAVDMAIDHLRQMGINNAIVNAGGDLHIIGRHGDRPWRIGIRNPRGPGMLASVDVEGDECVFTSGDYERFFEYEGVRYYHIIDPHTGYPARGTISVTVFGDKGGASDAAATALFIAGPEDWYEVAKAMGVKGVLLVDSRGTIYMTPNLKDRVYFDVKPKPKVIYSKPL
jgi:thiamine biosynthesis lipoprotein